MPSTRRCVASPLPRGNPSQIEYCETPRHASDLRIVALCRLPVANRGSPASDRFRFANKTFGTLPFAATAGAVSLLPYGIPSAAPIPTKSAFVFAPRPELESLDETGFRKQVKQQENEMMSPHRTRRFSY
jgi:hypothetical protein